MPLLPVVCRSFVEYLYARPAWRDDSLMLSSDVQGCVRGVLLPNGLRLMLRRRCEAAGVRYLNPHSFRHGLAVYLLNNGGDMSLVQRILGHSSIQTTALHYAEWVTEGLTKEFGNRMGRVGGGAPDCGSGRCGFEPHQAPQTFTATTTETALHRGHRGGTEIHRVRRCVSKHTRNRNRRRRFAAPPPLDKESTRDRGDLSRHHP
mgnify:CR=1 FL=1